MKPRFDILRQQFMGLAMAEAADLYNHEGKEVTRLGELVIRASSASLAIAICYALRAAHINGCMAAYDKITR